jgi:signal transduction histidine kinase
VVGVEGGAVEIEVGDAGSGFDPQNVPDERLGVRRSIVERTANAGGHAEVRAAVGRGTVIVLSWPAVSIVDRPAATPVSDVVVESRDTIETSDRGDA